MRTSSPTTRSGLPGGPPDGRVVEAVLFDIDGTLLDHDAASAGSLQSALERERDLHGLEAFEWAAALAEWRRLEELHYADYLSGEIPVEEHRRRRSAGILEWLGAPERHSDDLDEWFAAFLGGYRERWSVFDDVHPTVDRLEAQGAALGVITNADAGFQRRKLDAFGLLERMPAFVASSEAGMPKPEPEIFARACDLLGLEPARVAYVGDRLETDALGARDAGLLGVWLDRIGLAAGMGADDPGVPVIASLAELDGVLGA